MKVRASVKKICRNCKIIRRNGVVRVICTDGDVLFPAPALRSAAAVYGAEVVEITGAGHSPYFEKPDEFNAAVDQFLRDIDWTP